MDASWICVVLMDTDVLNLIRQLDRLSGSLCSVTFIDVDGLHLGAKHAQFITHSLVPAHLGMHTRADDP